MTNHLVYVNFKLYLCIRLVINYFVKGEHGFKFDGLSVGRHTIIFKFTPTNSSHSSPQKQYNFDVYPTGK